MTWLATESQAKTNLKKHTYWLPSKSMAMLCTSESILKGFEWIFHWCKYFWRCFWPLAWRMRTAAWQIRQNCEVKKFSKREVFNEKIIFWSTKSSGNVREALISISNLVISVSGTDCDSFTRSSSLGLARFTIMGGLGLASSFRWDSEFEIGRFEFESNQDSTVWNLLPIVSF